MGVRSNLQKKAGALAPGFKSLYGNVLVDDSVILGTESLTGAGALSITVPVSFLDTTGGAVAVTLAASTVKGVVKYIVMVKDGGNATLTLADVAAVGNTIVFAAIGDAITLINTADEDGTIIGWTLLSRESGVANTAAAFDGPAITTV